VSPTPSTDKLIMVNVVRRSCDNLVVLRFHYTTNVRVQDIYKTTLDRIKASTIRSGIVGTS